MNFINLFINKKHNNLDVFDVNSSGSNGSILLLIMPKVGEGDLVLDGFGAGGGFGGWRRVFRTLPSRR
jgi:hypothetical protein